MCVGVEGYECLAARGHVADHMILAGFQVVNGKNTQGEVR